MKKNMNIGDGGGVTQVFKFKSFLDNFLRSAQIYLYIVIVTD